MQQTACQPINKNMLLLELFRGSGEPAAQVKPVSYGRYSMSIPRTDGDPLQYDVFFRPLMDPRGVAEVNFYLIQGNELRQDITGTGNAVSVMAGVLKTVRDYLGDNPIIGGLSFTAAEKSRARLYRRLAMMIANEKNAGAARKSWKVLANDYGGFLVAKSSIAQKAMKSMINDDPSWKVVA